LSGVSESNQEDLLRRMVIQLQALESTRQELSSRLSLLEARLSEFNLASSTLEALKALEKGSEILIPIGGGSFVKAKVEETGKAVHSIGSGVLVEKSVEAAQSDLEERISEFQKLQASFNQQLEQVASAMASIRGQIQRLTEHPNKRDSGVRAP